MSKREKGYTLVELIIVIAILGILGAISIPQYLNWSKNAQYREAAQIAAAALMQAKGRAINTNQRVTVVFTIDDSSTNASNTVQIGTDASVAFPDGIEIKGTSDCDLENGTVNLAFNPDGTCQAGYICVFNGTVKKYRIGVGSTTTSRILTQRWNGSAWQ